MSNPTNPNETKTPTDSSGKPDLRFEFVGMMFAVTAGEIGIKCGYMAQNSPQPAGSKLAYSFPAICHLQLATLVVASSWVGWSRSRVSLAIRDVTNVFSAPFAVLILDVLLVICYFLLVETVELTTDNGLFTVAASAEGESFWIFVMFIGYLTWDILTKGFIKPEAEPRQIKRFERIIATAKRIVSRHCWKRAWVSAVCVVLSYALWRSFNGFNDYWKVIWADAALACLLLLFRSLKDLCSAFQPLSSEPDSELEARTKEDIARASIFTTVLFFCGIGCVLFAHSK